MYSIIIIENLTAKTVHVQIVQFPHITLHTVFWKFSKIVENFIKTKQRFTEHA